MESSKGTNVGKESTYPKSFFARGAEARLYKTCFLGIPALVKDRNEKKYRAKSLDDRIRASRTKTEARTIMKARAAGINAPILFSAGKFKLYFEKIDGKRLREAGKVSSKSWIEVGKLLANMHGAGITHGDFTPANIIIKKNKIYVIDFGLASISNEAEERAVDVLLMEKSIPKSDFSHFLKGYKSSKDWKTTLRRVEEIKKRGRYQIREAEKESGDETDQE